MKNLFFKTIITFTLFLPTVSVAQPKTDVIRLDKDWEFVRGDLGGIWESVRAARPGRPEWVPLWETVDIPHCFNGWDAVDPDVNYYEGPGWYRKNIIVENPYPSGRTLLHFEGAGQKTRVYVHTRLAGEHNGGYDEFTVDITDAVNEFFATEDAERFGGAVPVSIRVDNTRDVESIPSDMSDFNLYGGIYRHLNLVYVPALYIETVRLEPSLDPGYQSGELELFLGYVNCSGESGARLRIAITDPEGKKVISDEIDVRDFTSGLPVYKRSLGEPVLWSTDDPQLYNVEITLESPSGSMTLRERFGFRHFEFIEKGPFILNGERLLLRGVHRHEDHAGVGAAMSDGTIRREMEMIKEMGANFIRLGHYQQSRLVLDLCDELGILVWEEIPWCRGGLGGETYREQCRRMLRNMITQHRNHPSVILWGLGNENDWPGDFPEFERDEIRAFMSELHALSHELDNTRLTAIRRCSFCKDIVDVYSPSIWAGWYAGAYTDYKNASYAEMLGVDRFLHVEWGADSHAGRFTEDPYVGITPPQEPAVSEPGKAVFTGKNNNSNTGEWTESYACELIDWTLTEQTDMPWLTGAAYWSFKDFSTPLRPENPVPYVNQKGLVERDLTPKEAYYVFQSHWAEQPMVRIFGHRWDIRWGEPGEVKRLLVYSNCSEAELFLNGNSLGTKRRVTGDFPASGLRWDTPLEMGLNHVKVVAREGDIVLEDETTFEYVTRQWGPESAIKVSVKPDGEGFWLVDAVLVDKDGLRCADSRRYIEFEAAGDGTLIQNQGTSTGSRRVQAFNGRASIRLQSNGGVIAVAVRSDSLNTRIVEIPGEIRR